MRQGLPLQQIPQAPLTGLDLGPGGIQLGIAQSIDAWRQLPRSVSLGVRAVGEIPQAVGAADQQVEARVRAGVGLQGAQEVFRCHVSREVGQRQLAAGAGCRRGAGRIPVVGDGGKATAAGDAHPGAALFQVATGQQARLIGPESRGGGWPGVEFIAVRRQHQR